MPQPYPRATSGRFAGAAFALALHAGAVILLLQYEPVRKAVSATVPIMVSLITPPAVVAKPETPPKPLPVKPKVHHRMRPVAPPPVLAAVPEAPASDAAPSPSPAPPAPPLPAAPPVAAAPAPVIPPRFDARYLSNPPPAYPPLSRRLGEHGRVVLRVLVNARGTADKVEVESSSRSARLDDAALQAVQRWRFVPARQNGQPVAAWVLVPISFTLEG